MKRFLSIFLVLLISIYPVLFSVNVNASSIIGDATYMLAGDVVVDLLKTIYVDLNPRYTDEEKEQKFDNLWETGGLMNKFLEVGLYPAMDENSNINLNNLPSDSPIQYNSDTDLIEFKADFLKELQEQLNTNVTALDGYYLFVPTNLGYDDFDSFLEYFENNYSKLSASDLNTFKKNWDTCNPKFFFLLTSFSFPYIRVFEGNDIFDFSCAFIAGKTLRVVHNITNGNIDSTYRIADINGTGRISYYNNPALDLVKSCMNKYPTFGKPLKIFYSEQDLLNYYNRGKTYVPNILNITNNDSLYFPRKYVINNTYNEFTNINPTTITGNNETEIQISLDNIIKGILDGINNSNHPATPTPTPGFDDGSTLTPTPPFTPPDITPTPGIGGGDGDSSETNSRLEKIYKWLLSFGESHDTFSKKIVDYIEANDGKLDQIITALDKIASGTPTGEESGCKYDYTVLSEFLTQLWNESDKKFDKMVELLENNNEYQQKIVDSLNQIKALLVVDTVMDFFKDRSSSTANKAKDKFPTSIPWDIAMVVNAMCAEPQEPVIKLPINIGSLNIHEEITVDLSTDEWAKLAKTCRSMLSILFILYLVHLSRKLFFKGGDD